MGLAVSPQMIMAGEILRAKDERCPLEIRDISKVLLDLEDRGIDVGDVALRWVPGGVYSEDVEAFVGRFLAAGYAKARSPIEFFEDGLQVCRTILQDELDKNRDGFDAVVSALKRDYGRFIAPRPR